MKNERIRIFIHEDYRIRDLFKMILDKAHYEIRESGLESESVRILLNESFELAILDADSKVYAILIEICRNKKMKVLALGDFERYSNEYLKPFEGLRYIQKPFKLESFFDALVEFDLK